MLGNEYEGAKFVRIVLFPGTFSQMSYLTPVGPISVHATSLGQAEQLTYVGSVTRMITHFVSRVDYTGGPWRVRF